MRSVVQASLRALLALLPVAITAGCGPEAEPPRRPDAGTTDAVAAVDARVADLVVAPIDAPGGATDGQTCVAQELPPTPSLLDVIVVVDSSPSFNAPRQAISMTLASSLVAELERERIDYRMVVFGGAVTAPPPTTPPRYFFVPRSIGSGNLLAALPTYLRDVRPHLRADALKAVIVFTDGTSNIGPRSAFYAGMMAVDLMAYFGAPSMRRYSVHTVAGLAANMPPSLPWPPTAPVVNATCAGFRAVPCQELQLLSIETGGYRFPICNFAEFGSFFNAVARQGIARARVPCAFDVPAAIDGRVPDPAYSRMTIRFSNGMTREHRPLADPALCGEGYHATPGAAGTPARLTLCPSTCTAVQDDPGASISVTYECPPA